MAERNPALWLQGRMDHTAENERAVLHVLHGGVEGVLGFGDLKVTQRAAGAGMFVDVAPGRAAIRGDSSVNQGMYQVWSDSVVTLPIASSDGTNPRQDIVVARVRDAFYTGDTDEWKLEVITGQPSATPSAPETPDNAIRLAVVTVPANASSITDADIADRRVPGGAWAQPRGFVGRTNLSGSAGGSETALTGSVTHAAEAGRYYKVTAQYGVYTSGDQGNVFFRLKRNGVTVGTHSENVGGSSFPDRASGTIVRLEEGTSGTMTWSATLQCISATRSLNTQISPCHIVVEDIGGFVG